MLQNATEVLERLKSALEAPTDQALADKLGVARGTVAAWRSRNTLDWPKIIEASGQADISLDWLLLDISPPDPILQQVGRMHRGGGGIPVVSHIEAGLMSLYEVERYAEEHIPITQETLARTGESLFGLRLVGDSMYPYMQEGDVAICSPVRTPEVGHDVAFYRQSTGESTVKRLNALDRKRHRARLLPLNPDYDPITVSLEPGDQLAVVVGLFRDTSRPSRRIPGFQ